MQGRFRLEILDLENTSGNPQMIYTSCDGRLLPEGKLKTKFHVGFRNDIDAYSVPVMMIGKGEPTMGAGYVPNPRIRFTINGEESGNSSWLLSPYRDKFEQYGYYSDDNIATSTEAADLRNPYFGDQFVELVGENGISEGTSDDVLYSTTKRGRIDLFRMYETGFQEMKTYHSGQDEAWISYDVSHDITNKKVFAYSIEILERISGLSGTTFIQDVWEPTVMNYWSGFTYSGNCDLVSLLLDTTGLFCVSPGVGGEDDPNNEKEVCIESGLTPAQLKAKIQEIMSGLTNAERSKGNIDGNMVDDSDVITNPLSLQYSIYKGEIKYNSPFTGDSITFTPYTYDYTGRYFAKYGVNPPHSQFHLDWTYDVDYKTPQQLVNKFNQDLSGKNYWLWIPELDCVDTSQQGYFESGNLLTARLDEDGNTIYVESTRLGVIGQYKWGFYEADRPVNKPSQNAIKYLMPNRIRFEGANEYGNWTVLDEQTDINWQDIKPVKARTFMYDFYTGYLTGESGILQNEELEESDMNFEGKITPRVILTGAITGKNKCGEEFYKKITFLEVPSGFDCASPDLEVEKDPKEKDENGLEVEQIKRPVDYYFLKTGFKFNNTNDYNYYRLVFDEFLVDGRAQTVVLDSSFFINSINLYGVETGHYMHSGEICLMGASYTGQVMGYTTGEIEGTLVGEAGPDGVLRFSKHIVSGVPNTNGIVPFPHSMGKATTLFTGLVTADKTGIKYYEEKVQGYFYDEETQCINFEQTVSGTITGSGQLIGGPYALVYPEVMIGINETQVITGEDYAFVTGIIPKFLYNFTNIPAFSRATGTISADVPSGVGRLSTNELVQVIPESGYSFSISGTKEAEVQLSYGVAPQVGDRIFINDSVIIYDVNPNNQAPTYYKDNFELVNIINSGADNFLATAQLDGGTIRLKSTLLGESGNSITVRAVGQPSFSAPTFTGGVTYHYPLTPTSLFTGTVTDDLVPTGRYEVEVTGEIVGEVKQLDFVRKFTDIWNLTTGNVDFREGGLVSDALTAYDNSLAPMPYYTEHPAIIPVLVSYVNSPLVLSNDLAKLTITGNGMGTGITMILSGQI